MRSLEKLRLSARMPRCGTRIIFGLWLCLGGFGSLFAAYTEVLYTSNGKLNIVVFGSGKAMIPPSAYLIPAPVEWKENLWPVKIALFRADGTRVAPKRWPSTRLVPPVASDFKMLQRITIPCDLWKIYDLVPGAYTLTVRYEFLANYPGLNRFHLRTNAVYLKFVIRQGGTD